MENKTAVEWLLDNLNSEPYSEADFKHNKECWDKAIEMEKEQILEAFFYGTENAYEVPVEGVDDAEFYYNDKFKK
jgi:hypothetical protein